MAKILKIKKPTTQFRKEMFDGAFEVRDAREHDFFIVDNVFLRDKWLRLLKGAPAAVYFALCRHADKKQLAFPAIPYLMDETGYARRQVIVAIQVLEQHRLIKVHRTRGDHNMYTLLNRKLWKKVVTKQKVVDKGDPYSHGCYVHPLPPNPLGNPLVNE